MIKVSEAIGLLREYNENGWDRWVSLSVYKAEQIAELIEFLSQTIKQQNMDIAKLQEDLINVIAKRTDGENK